MNQQLYALFDKLTHRARISHDGIPAASLPFNKNHKIGVNEDGAPMFFVKTSRAMDAKFVELDLIRVRHNAICSIYEEKATTRDVYTIIELRSANMDYVKYFIEVVGLLLKQLPILPSPEQLDEELKKLTALFKCLSGPARKTVQGLWAELFLIAKSNNPEYLVGAWHVSPEDRYDFNDGVNKIEVKSSSRDARIHRFSFAQLSDIAIKNLIVASVFVLPSGKGSSVFDLKEIIDGRVKHPDLRLKLAKIIAQTLGADFIKAGELQYDDMMAKSTLRFYRASDIPTIASGAVPDEVSGVRFDSDLSNVEPIRRNMQKNSLIRSAWHEI
jgi:hypothetical protein